MRDLCTRKGGAPKRGGAGGGTGAASRAHWGEGAQDVRRAPGGWGHPAGGGQDLEGEGQQ